MKKDVREFLECEEVGAARSNDAKRAKRKKARERFRKFIIEKAEQMEANGNRAGAEQYRKFWGKFGYFPSPTRSETE